MKKRYNKLVAYLLMDFSTLILLLPVGLVKSQSDCIVAGIISIIFTTLLTLYINSRTPKGERVGTWCRAWWLGFKIAWKIALCCTLVLIPAMLKKSIEISEKDFSESNPHWYDERGRVRDDLGNEYKVGHSGEYVQDNKGNWQKVNRDGSGDPYIGSESDRTYLK